MMKYVLVALLGSLLLAACSQAESSFSPTASTTPSVATAAPPTAVEVSSSPRWIEAEMDGVQVGIWLPNGWIADSSNGLTLLEHISSIPNGVPASGIIAYVFVPELSTLLNMGEQPENLAHAALQRVTHSPAHIGNAIVGEAIGFVWDSNHAAYYLYSDNEGVCGIVLAVAIDEAHIVVANVTAPTAESYRLREILPQFLGDMMLNRHRFSDSFISILPDPLVFPTERAS